MLGHGGEDVDREAVGMGVVGGDEIDPGLHQRCEEGDVSAQAIDLGHQERRPRAPSKGHCGGKLQPVIALSRLDLLELSEDLSPSLADEGLHIGLLGFEPEAPCFRGMTRQGEILPGRLSGQAVADSIKRT